MPAAHVIYDHLVIQAPLGLVQVADLKRFGLRAELQPYGISEEGIVGAPGKG
jgi:hypothetical protein